MGKKSRKQGKQFISARVAYPKRIHPYPCIIGRSQIRDCLNFPIKIILSSSLHFLPVFPVSSRQITRYHPRKNDKTSSKENLKPDPSKIQMSSKTPCDSTFSNYYTENISKEYNVLFRSNDHTVLLVHGDKP